MEKQSHASNRQHCFFDIEIENVKVGRIIFELFSDVVPRTTENFRVLCLGTLGRSSSGVMLSYKKTKFHRVIKNFMIQGGDIMNSSGKGGESIYGPAFEDEICPFKHDKPFLLSMANKGASTNSSQFFITTVPCPHLDGKNVIFGKVVEGKDVVTKIENVAVNGRYFPVIPIVVSNCGEIEDYNGSNKDRHTSRTNESKKTVKEEEDLDPGVMPPPEVLDTRPNWLDRTIYPSRHRSKNYKKNGFGDRHRDRKPYKREESLSPAHKDKHESRTDSHRSRGKSHRSHRKHIRRSESTSSELSRSDHSCKRNKHRSHERRSRNHDKHKHARRSGSRD